MKKDYFRIRSLRAQVALLIRRSRPAATFIGDGPVPAAAGAATGDFHDDNDDWNLKETLGLDDSKRVSAKGLLPSFWDIFRAKRCKVPGTVVETVERATELVNHEFFVDAGLSTEQISIKCALPTARIEAKEALDLLGLL